MSTITVESLLGEARKKIALRCGQVRRLDARNVLGVRLPPVPLAAAAGTQLEVLAGTQALHFHMAPGYVGNPRRLFFLHNASNVQELLEKGSKVIVLSRGMQLMLQTCPETLQLLKDRGVGVHVEETRRAAELYNKLAESEPIGGLFHSTC